jgi:acylglycerol lipase
MASIIFCRVTTEHTSRVVSLPLHILAMIEKWVTGPQLTQFFTRTYLPTSGSPSALIVFLHGFAEHSGRYSHFHPILSERQIAVWTFDQRGFGRTALDQENSSKTSSWGKTGWSDQMQDLDWAVKTAMKEVPGVPMFLFGHSMVRKRLWSQKSF